MDLLQLVVKKIIHETKDAITIRLETADGSEVPYEAGQFLTLIFDHDLRRSYSFSSTPGIDKYLSITVKRVQNGQVSRFLMDHANEGTVLNSLAPSGMFTIETDATQQRQFFFIAVGSGITPIYSLIKKILLTEALSSIVLIYQNHDEKNIIFKNQLKKLEKKFAGSIKWINLLTSPRKYPHEGTRLTNLLLEKLVTEHAISEREKIFYLCGPSTLMRMSQFTLKLMGFTDTQIRKENFTIDFVPPPPLIDSNDPKQLIIHHQQKDYTIAVSYPMNILQAALNNNIQLPYSCRGGRCSTCVAKLIKGKVMMSINEVLTEKDIQDGLVLTCVGYAATDVELRI